MTKKTMPETKVITPKNLKPGATGKRVNKMITDGITTGRTEYPMPLQQVSKEDDDLVTALRLIKLRWDDLDFNDQTQEGRTHGIFFTSEQLQALAQLARPSYDVIDKEKRIVASGFISHDAAQRWMNAREFEGLRVVAGKRQVISNK